MEELFKQNNQKKIFQIFLAASVAVHLVLLISKTPGISFDKAFSKKEEEKIIRVKFLNNSINQTKRQIVQTEQMNNELKPIDKVYLGKKNNRVDRQTKSATVGKFKSAGVGDRKGTKQSQNVKKQVAKKKVLKNLKFSDLALNATAAPKPIKKKVQKTMQVAKGLKNGSSKSQGLGQTNDYIEDVPLGDFTKLNTQEFEFYGFYNRIRQRLELFWGSNIQEQAEKLMKTGRSIASDTNHVTSLEIFLNDRGEIVDVSINSPSGVRELDSAAIKTFNQAGPFPNPPTGMLKDGKAKISWSFVVNT